MKIDEILIELGNTGIKGTLKPNDYYKGKILEAKQSLFEAIEKVMPKECKEYDEEDEGYNLALQDCLTNLKELFK